jgi:hypothetical protein
MTDFEKLKTLAYAAVDRHAEKWFLPSAFLHLQMLENDDADYIAAASPVLVLSLIQKIEQMEVEIAAHEDFILRGLANAQAFSLQYDLDARKATRLGHEIESFEDRLARMMDRDPHQEAATAFASVANKASE